MPDSDRVKLLLNSLQHTTSRGMDWLLELAKQHHGNLTVNDVHLLAKESWQIGSVGICPELIVNFISQYVSKRQIQSILDPWAGLGTLLLPLVNKTGATTNVGISPDKNATEFCKLLDHEHKVTWLCGEPLEELNNTTMSFDLVISCPPFGINPTKVSLLSDTGPVEVQDNPGHLIVLKSCLRLADKGLGHFVVSTGFVGN